MAAHLSADLRKTVGRRAVIIRKGDTVKIMRGNSKGKQGKIATVNYKHRKLTIEGMVRKKSDGTDVPMPFQPSNLMIVTLDTTGKNRIKPKGGK